MDPTILLTIEAIIVLLGPVLLGWWIQQRFGSHWSSWGWGAVAFVGSQVVRIPLLIALTELGRRYANPSVSEEWAFWSNTLVLSITAGLFEESARYIVMSRFAPRVRNWREGIMFGAGHGGIEAMLFVGGAVINSLVLLSMGESVIEQVRAADPSQVDAVIQQLELLRTMAWWMPAAAILERVLAMTFHIAASLLVMRAVRRGSYGATVWAMIYHTLFNGIALVVLRFAGGAASTVALILLTLPALWIIYSMYQAEPTEAPIEEGL